ncbi:MAG: adaptor protein MecA [Clostridia bacterium]|nr:adaptor protein MecA [Clostridia bacterium]
MELIQIGTNALKVTLTKEDMAFYAIDFEQLDYKNTETRHALWSILDEAKRTLGFEAARDRLYIQAFKDKRGGCELFVRRTDPKEEAIKSRSLFRFSDMRALLCACARLQNCGFSGESRALIGDDGAWYLTLGETAASDPRFYLTELGTSLPADGMFLCEHATHVCDNAVEILSALR